MVAPVGVQVQPTTAVAEEDVRHARPLVIAGHRALEAGQVPAVTRLVVRSLHPSGVLGGHEQEDESGRGLEAPHVRRLLADVRVELDAPPPEGVRLEGRGTPWRRRRCSASVLKPS